MSNAEVPESTQRAVQCGGLGAAILRRLISVNLSWEIHSRLPEQLDFVGYRRRELGGVVDLVEAVIPSRNRPVHEHKVMEEMAEGCRVERFPLLPLRSRAAIGGHFTALVDS